MTDLFLTPTKQIARAASFIMLAFILSNLTGLLRQILVARAFGTGLEIEAFNAANRVSETLFNLAAGGALASAFIPTFTGLLTQKRIESAWRLASSIFNILVIILCAIIILAIYLAPDIVKYVLAPGFVNNPLKTQLTSELLIIMLPSALLFSISGLIMGVLNSNQIFFIPALTPSMYQLGMIFGVLVLTPRFGIFGLAWGVVIGSNLHILLQLPTLFSIGVKYFPNLGLHLPEVREVGRLMLPRLLGVAFVQLNFWINIRLASSQSEGSVTGLVIAFALMLMPQAAIAQSIAIAALPTLSSQYTLGKFDELRSTLSSSLRGLLLLSLPATFGLILLRKPIIEMLYQRGEFTVLSTELVSWALFWYALGLVGHCMVEVMVRAYYSMHDTKMPVLIGTVAMSINVVFSYIFSDVFNRLGWMPHGGLAFANSLATALEFIGLYFFMHRRLDSLEDQRIVRGGVAALIGSVVMSVGLWFWVQFTNDFPSWFVTMVGIFIGLISYAAMLFIQKVPELRSISISRLWIKLRG